MSETRKALENRIKTGWFGKYAPADKPGIDIGGGIDPLTHPVYTIYDKPEGDATYMANVPNESYYTVYASHILEHLSQPMTAIKNWWRILKPGGHLIIVVPHRDLYEKKIHLPSRWNDEHKTFWMPDRSENEFTLGLNETVRNAIPEGEIIYCKVRDEGFVSHTPHEHSDGEYSIEIVVKKVV